MKPSSLGRYFSTIARSRRRSRSPSIRRETPTRGDPGHQHQVPARDGDARGDARALGAERLLRDLDDDLVALLKHVLDLRRRAGAAARAAPAVLVVEVGVVELGAVVADVQEAGALEADVDEGGLHSGQDAGDSTLVDAPDDAALVGPLDVELDDLVGLAQRRPATRAGRRLRRSRFASEIPSRYTLASPAMPFRGMRGRAAEAGTEAWRTVIIEGTDGRTSGSVQGRRGAIWPGPTRPTSRKQSPSEAGTSNHSIGFTGYGGLS